MNNLACSNILVIILIVIFVFGIVSELELPKETDESVENVNSEAFWNQCNLGILHRGILRGNTN